MSGRMRPAAVVLILVTVAACVICPTRAAGEGGTPRIKFDELKHDFGAISPGSRVSYTFTFANTGTAALLLKQPRPDCGCTAAILSSRRIAPGDTGEINVTFKSAGRQGPQVKRIRIPSNDPSNPEVILTITGDIKVVIKAVPTALRFDRVMAGDTPVKSVALTPKRGVTILSAKSSLEFVEVELKPGPAGVGGNAKTMVVKLGARAPIGRRFGNIEVKTSSAEAPVFLVGVSTHVTGDVAIQPEIVSVRMKKGERRYRSVKLTRASGGLSISGANVNSEFVTTEVRTIKEGTEYEIGVWVEQEIPLGKTIARMEVKTSSKIQPVITIQVRINVEE